LTVSTKRVRQRGGLVKLRGKLEAPRRKGVCQVRQKIAIQRRNAGQDFFLTFDVAVSKANGKFSIDAYPVATATYRARVTQTNKCEGATSKLARVSVKASSLRRASARRR
jgi:hypothetical protein